MKFFTTVVALLCLSQAGFSQTDSARVNINRTNKVPKASDFNTWEIGVHGGLTSPNTDISATNVTMDNYKGSMGYGLMVNKFFSHNFALQGNFITAKLAGSNADDSYSYKTEIKYDATVNAVFHLGNVSFLKRTPNFGIFLYLGVGYMSFTPTNYHGDTLLPYNVYKDNSQGVTQVNYSPTAQLVVPVGIGMRYHFSKHFSVQTEYSFRTTTTDKLDGWNRLLSENDAYHYASVGVTYGIGRKEKTIEWVNPMSTIYADLYDTKEKVDMMTGDQDHDGVADMFDKDNSTAEGIKVYGDGTAVDSDGDGVPDNLDAEPFSSKGSKVDAQGRELDGDGDGVPDSRDRETDTPKSSLVDYNGVNLMPSIAKASGRPMVPAVAVGTSTGTNGAGTTGTEVSPVAYSNVSNIVSNGYFPSVFFDVNSAVIQNNYEESLADMALILLNNPDFKLVLESSCDVRASDDYNNSLGNKRAMAVKSHFVKKYKIDAGRFTIVNKGKTSPITYDHAMNRRVDFKVTQ